MAKILLIFMVIFGFQTLAEEINSADKYLGKNREALFQHLVTQKSTRKEFDKNIQYAPRWIRGLLIELMKDTL